MLSITIRQQKGRLACRMQFHLEKFNGSNQYSANQMLIRKDKVPIKGRWADRHPPYFVLKVKGCAPVSKKYLHTV